MPTTKQVYKHILTFLLLGVVFSGCNAVYAEAAGTNDEPTVHHEQKGLNWPGIYNGLLPCADCYGVKTSIALNKNNTYILIYQYTGKSQRDFVEKGKYVEGEKENTIVLTSKDGSTIHKYLVGKDMLTQLDKGGDLYVGNDAERYILRRTDVTKKGPSHPQH
jgi:copper homeostasis protein (lipoprotein)